MVATIIALAIIHGKSSKAGFIWWLATALYAFHVPEYKCRLGLSSTLAQELMNDENGHYLPIAVSDCGAPSDRDTTHEQAVLHALKSERVA